MKSPSSLENSQFLSTRLAFILVLLFLSLIFSSAFSFSNTSHFCLLSPFGGLFPFSSLQDLVRRGGAVVRWPSEVWSWVVWRDQRKERRKRTGG